MTIRRIIYQSVVVTTATIGAVAPTTPKTAGIQDFDPPKFGRQFKATQEPIVQTFVTGAVNQSVPDGDGEFRLPLTQKRVPVHLYQDVASIPFGYVANTPNTAGLQDFGPLFQRPFKSVSFPDIINAPRGYIANTPTTSGLQDFDRPAVKRAFSQIEQTSAPQFTVAATAVQFVGYDPFVRRRPISVDFNTFFQITAVATTPTTAGLQGLDQKAAYAGRWIIADFAGAVSSPTLITLTFQDFDRPTTRRRVITDLLSFVSVPTAATVTPITAGLQDLTPVLFQKPWKPANQQFTSLAPFAPAAGTATPITAGLQDFAPWLFVKPFKANLQQDHALAPFGYVANTPNTSGLQDFGPLFQKGFRATLQQLDAITPSGTYVPANTPITGGVQNFDFRFQKSFNVSLQSVGPFGTSVIVYAATPTSFQFALADMKPLRQVFPAYQQQFVAAQMYGDVPAPPTVVEVKYFPFIANVGTMMCR